MQREDVFKCIADNKRIPQIITTSVGMELEKVTEKKQTRRRLMGDELKCRRELSMPSGFPFLLITEALSVCFLLFELHLFSKCESRTSLL